jgi:ATP-binding cassette subfamily B protein
MSSLFGAAWRAWSITGARARFWLAMAAADAAVAGVAYWLLISRAGSSLRCLQSRDTASLLGCGGPSLATVAIALAALLTVGAARHVIELNLQIHLISDITELINSVVDRLPYEVLDDNEFQASYGIALREAPLRLFSLSTGLVRLLVALLAAASIASQLFLMSWTLTLAFILSSLPMFAADAYSSMLVVRNMQRTGSDQLRMQLLMRYQVDPIAQRDLRVGGLGLMAALYQIVRNRYMRSVIHVGRAMFAARMLAAAFNLLFLATATAVVLYELLNNQIEFTRLAVFVPAAYALTLQLGSVSDNASRLFEGLSILHLVFGIEHTTTDSPPAGRRIQLASETRQLATGFRLRSVSYRYPASQAVGLTDVSMDLARGIHVIMGPNGSGKSTLLKVIAGLLTPTDGDVVQLTSSVATLFQEPTHLPVSIGQFVTQKRELDEQQMERTWEVLSQIGLADVVAALPNRLDTVLGVGLGGDVELSGGQWKRLAIARALFTPGADLVLDEPETGLDIDAMHLFAFEIDRLRCERSIIIATHMPNLMQGADRIYVMSGSRLVESGTHAELSQRPSGLYSDLTRRGLR